MTRLAALTLTVILTLGLAPAPAYAQNLFAPAITVNEDVITAFEVEQRQQFLRIINSPEDPLDQLIGDRLRSQAASQAGLVLTDADIDEAKQ